MLQLYNKNKVKIKGLKSYKDYKIESILSSGDKKLSFLYSFKLGKEIEEEGYIQNRTDEFIIKEIVDNGDWKSIVATMNVENLEGQAWTHFDTTEQTISECLSLAVAGTGWTVSVVGSITKKRTVRMTNSSSWQIIQQAQKTYKIELEFDTLNKIIKVYQTKGSDKGAYYIDSLNLRALEIQGNSYDFYTRIIAIGKDDLTVTVSNFQYSSKIKTLIWKDERYTDISSLTEDATLKLAEISMPYKAYGADVVDLANLNNKYKDILAYSLGDTITLIDSDKGIKEKQRIVKIIDFPEEPEKNSCEIANKKLSFTDVQKEEKDNLATIDNITEDNGTISESAIKVAVDHLTIDKLDVNSLNAVYARIGTLEATTINVTQLNAVNANIINLQADKANIIELTASVARITILEADTASIKTIFAGNITAEMIATGTIVAGSGVIADGAIGNAMISSLNAVKITAGIIDTAKVTIQGANGRLKITGNRLQVFAGTTSLYERVSLGDVNGDGTIYGIRVRGSDGTTILFDETGVKREGITDGSINNSKIGIDANISGLKLDIASVVTSINAGTTKIQSSSVYMDDKTLDIKFSELSTTVTDIEVGGRNLLLNSDFEDNLLWIGSINSGSNSIVAEAKYSGTLGWKCVTNANSTTSGGCVMCPNLVVGNKYTASLKIKCTTTNSVMMAIFNGTGWVSAGTLVKSLSFGVWTTLSISFTATETSHKIAVLNGSPNATIYYVDNIKVELGNKPTDWTPAPEDVDQKIEANTALININTGSISLAITDLTYMKTASGISTFSDIGTSIKLAKDSISNKVWNADIETLINFQNSKPTLTKAIGGTISGNNFTKTAATNSWNSGCSSIETVNSGQYAEFTIDQVGVNIMFGLNTTDPDANFTSMKYVLYQTGANLCIYESGASRGNIPGVIIHVGDVLRISVDGDTVHYYQNGVVVYTSLVKNTYGILIIDVSVYQIGAIVSNITIGSSISSLSTRITTAESSIIQNTSDITARVSTLVYNAKVNSLDGDIAAVENRLTTAELKITNTAIIASVSSTIATAKTEAINSSNGTTTTKLASYSTTAQLDAKIVILNNSISSKVTQTQVDTSILSASTLPDTRSANSTPAWYWANYPKQVISEFKYRTIIGAPGSTTYGASVTTIPWNGVSGGEITQEFKSTDGTFKRTSTSDTTWGSWTEVEDTSGSQAKANVVASTVTALTTRVSSAETKITPTAITSTISSQLNGTGSIITTKLTLNSSGLTVKNGAMTVQNTAGVQVFGVNTAGDLVTKTILIEGSDENLVLTGPGHKGVEIRATSSGTAYIDFSNSATRSDYSGRIYLTPNSDAMNVIGSSLTVHTKLGASTLKWDTYPAALTVMGKVVFRQNLVNTGNGATQIVNSATTDECRILNSGMGWGYLACRTIVCTGGKPALVDTPTYGETYMWAEESTHIIFSDDGTGVVEDDGLCYVYLDPHYLETVSTKLCDYMIQLTGWSGCQAEIYDKQADYFVVSGVDGKKFDWKISAERKGYERQRFNQANLEI